MNLAIDNRRLICAFLSKLNDKTPLRALIAYIVKNGSLPDFSKYHLISDSEFQEFYHNLTSNSAGIISVLDSIYPELLKQIYDPPGLIYYKGNKELLNKPKISIIGGRNASYSDLKFISEVAKFLAERDFIIVSGLANGVDTSAHQGAGPKNTIAVIASGLDICYPKQNYKLFEAIKNQGLVISESHFGCPPIAKLFPRRNRIIVGLSSLTIASNVKFKSGSMLTCRLVIENNRELIVIPGSPNDIMHEGSNSLIKDGAQIFTSFKDLESYLGSLFLGNANLCNEHSYAKNEIKEVEIRFQEIIKLIPSNGVQMEELLMISNIANHQLLELVSEMEMEELIYVDFAKRIFLK
ncbi:MAG: DNA-protecting protein DprA [Rickettsiales bacterium]|jgi:DNA processing protein|nr:DNA-protecting protein DprA [Rickettsiales bacterium]